MGSVGPLIWVDVWCSRLSVFWFIVCCLSTTWAAPITPQPHRSGLYTTMRNGKMWIFLSSFSSILNSFFCSCAGSLSRSILSRWNQQWFFFANSLIHFYSWHSEGNFSNMFDVCMQFDQEVSLRCWVRVHVKFNFFFCILLLCHPWTWKPEPSRAHHHHSVALRVSSWKGIHHVLGQHSIVSTLRFALFIFSAVLLQL